MEKTIDQWLNEMEVLVDSFKLGLKNEDEFFSELGFVWGVLSELQKDFSEEQIIHFKENLEKMNELTESYGLPLDNTKQVC